MKICQFENKDAAQIAQLFHDTIRYVNNRDYSERQVKAWAPENLFFRNWKQECLNNYTYVAEENGQILGFAELEENGHINCFYCHKDHQKRGVGTRLYRYIELKAEELGLMNLHADVSITARPFFLKMGFEQKKEQTVTTRGVRFSNYRMVKSL